MKSTRLSLPALLMAAILVPERAEATRILEPFLPSSVSVSQEPSYAKWSRLAVQEAQKRQYRVLDYRYIGLKELSPYAAEQQFKLWVQQNEEPFSLYVTVRYNPKSDKLIRISTKESHP